MKHYVRPAHKHRGSLLFIVLLLVMLVCWWALSFVQVALKSGTTVVSSDTRSETASELAFDASYVPPAHLQVTHSSTGGTVSYSGALVLPNCDTLSTRMSTGSLDFVVSKTDQSCSDTGTSSVPFLLTYSKNMTSPKVIVAEINNQFVDVALQTIDAKVTEAPFKIAPYKPK